MTVAAGGAGGRDMTRRNDRAGRSRISRTADVLLYSLGSLDEGHGPALPRRMDDHFAVRCAVDIFARTGFPYRKHLPYVSDRVGEIARDWCPLWMPPDDLIRSVTDDLRGDIARWPRAVSHVVLINGHGGNNFLKDHERALSRKIGRPVFFAVPMEGDGIRHPQYGLVRCTHADSGEHSLAAFLGLLDRARLRTVNAVAARDPGKALARWKPIAGLGWYVLFGGPRYEALRKPEYGLLRTAREFLENPVIIGDPDIGRRFYVKHLEKTIRSIRRFIAAGT